MYKTYAVYLYMAFLYNVFRIKHIKERKMGDLTVLSQWIADLAWEEIPEEVREAVLLHVLDSVASALGARNNRQIRAVTKEYLKLEAGEGASLWGKGAHTSPGCAAFLNAMMGHTLEMDDVHVRSKSHIGTVVVPAAWAAAEYLGRSGQDFLKAVVCGYETMSRVGMAFGVSGHRNRGWHATATAGTFGAAAAAASLMNLGAEETMNALGLAGAQSFGTWAFLGDGASCKVLNPARAARSGLEAAVLAGQGMTGPAHILTAEDGGLLDMMGDGGDIQAVSRGVGRVWECLCVDTKPYPSCRSTHSIIDAVLALRREHGIEADQVENVRVETYLVGNKQCGMTQASRFPATPPAAKFSTPYVVSCALLTGNVSLAHFEQQVIDDPRVREFLPKVKVETSQEFTEAYPEHWGSRTTIYMKDGRRYSAEVKDASGSVCNPLSRDQMLQKAMGMMEAGGVQDPEQTAQKILDLPGAKKLPEV